MTKDSEKNGLAIIVGAGSLGPGDLRFKKDPGDLVVAADAGYLSLKEAGIVPDLLIADFDSMAEEPFQGELIRLPVVKDDTDTAFAVKEVLRRGYRRILMLGGLGGKRISHSLANLQLLRFIREAGAFGTLRYGLASAALFMKGECIRFPETERGTVSLFAASGEARVTIRGLFYEGDHLSIRDSFPIGVSNHLTGASAFIRIHEGSVFLIREEEEGIRSEA